MDPERRYWHDVIGYSYRMTNLQAALGVAQTRKIAGLVERKRRLAGWYAAMLPPYACGERMPAAEDLGARGINLPSGADLDRDQLARVVKALGEALDA